MVKIEQEKELLPEYILFLLQIRKEKKESLQKLQ